MSILKDFSFKNTSFPKNAYMTYHEKLKNELEKIPKLKKKFFVESLAKHKFDSDVYIPQNNAKNRKIHPEKDYLLNKIVTFDNKVDNERKKIDTISKDFSKFFKFYNFLKDNNIKQRDYMTNLVSIYKEKNNNIEDIDYKKDENIFSNSILLETNNNTGNGTDNDDFKKYGNPDSKIMLHNDEKILINFDRVIHHKMSPNSSINRQNNNTENFITGINQSYYINKNNRSEIAQLKKENKTETNMENTNDKIDKYKLGKKSKEGIKEEIKMGNKNIKSNTLDKYIINSRLLKINKTSRNKINNDFISNKSGSKNFTYHNSNNALNTEEKPINDASKISNLKRLSLKGSHKEELENKNINIKTIKSNIESEKRTRTFSLNNRINKKYLLTTLNKINTRDKIDDISGINTDKMALNPENENYENNRNNIIKSTEKRNLKINLPDIDTKKNMINKSINYTEINETNKLKKIQKKKIIIKKDNSNKNHNYKKTKEKEINRLYSTISSNSKFFREFPYLKIKNYFKKYNNINIKKVVPEKGSNLYPVLDNIENIVKNKDISKIAKSLDDTKQYLILKKTKTDNLELKEDKTLPILEKINESEKLFPLIKYDCADKIVLG